MNADYFKSFVLDNGVTSAYLSLVTDLDVLMGYISTAVIAIGVMVFTWGFLQLIQAANPSTHDVNYRKAAWKILFGPMLVESQLVMEQGTESLWLHTEPGEAYTYISQAKNIASADPVGAIWVATMALIVLVGRLTFYVALYRFATVGEAQDKHRSALVSLGMLIGSLLLINIGEVGDDFYASLGLSGQSAFSAYSQ